MLSYVFSADIGNSANVEWLYLLKQKVRVTEDV